MNEELYALVPQENYIKMDFYDKITHLSQNQNK